MLEIIGFIIVCLAWQAIKNAFRGNKREPELSIHVGGIHAVAECGCDMIDNHEFVPCAYHMSRGGLVAFQKDQALEKARRRIEVIRKRVEKGGLSLKQMENLTEELARLKTGSADPNSPPSP